MNCPNCGHGEHRVIRTAEKDGRVRRTRECLKCAGRWHTIEAPEAIYQQAADVVEVGRRLRDVIGE